MIRSLRSSCQASSLQFEDALLFGRDGYTYPSLTPYPSGLKDNGVLAVRREQRFQAGCREPETVSSFV